MARRHFSIGPVGAGLIASADRSPVREPTYSRGARSTGLPSPGALRTVRISFESTMTLSAEQRAAVSQWIAAGDSLAVVQRKLADELKVSMTYMEVRFLVDDLGLEMKTPAPKFSAPPAAAPAPAAEPAPKKGLFGKLKDAVTGKGDDNAPADEPALAEGEPPYDEEAPADLPPLDPNAPASTLKVEVDRLTRPGTLASGTVTFSDGVAGKWAMDQYGRLMLDAGKGYKPSQADVQAFQVELSTQLQRMGY